jgi:hypothetical protein
MDLSTGQDMNKSWTVHWNQTDMSSKGVLRAFRAALSRLFPRYGHYCGPNYSSGRGAGPLTWDQAPVDHLDNCCYRHDMAYDSHDQSILLEVSSDLLWRIRGCIVSICLASIETLHFRIN